MIRARAIAAVLATTLVAAAAAAQTPATIVVDDVRVEGSGRHVVIVSVLDAAGAPVAGLASAFRVALDGAAVERVAAEDLRAVRPRATVTVVADRDLFAGIAREDRARAFRSLGRVLGPEDRVRLIAAGGGALHEAAAPKAEDLAAGMDDTRAAEAPRLYDALADAVRSASRLPARRGAAVLVVTRGADGGSRRGPIDALALARSRARHVPIVVVLLGGGGVAPESERLRRLAEGAGGAFAEVTSVDGAGDAMAALAPRALDRWRLSFDAPGWDRAASRHRLRVEVAHGGAHRAVEHAYATADALASPWWRQPLPWLLLGLAVLVAAGALLFLRPRQLGLLVHDGDAWDGVWYDLFGFPVSIGGAAGNDLVLADAKVSRNHAVLERRGRAVELADLNSENGTFVNGQRITRQRLADGDRVSFGPDVHVIYEARG